jgi:hypothetical protein
VACGHPGPEAGAGPDPARRHDVLRLVLLQVAVLLFVARCRVAQAPAASDAFLETLGSAFAFVFVLLVTLSLRFARVRALTLGAFAVLGGILLLVRAPGGIGTLLAVALVLGFAALRRGATAASRDGRDVPPPLP